VVHEEFEKKNNRKKRCPIKKKWRRPKISSAIP
jgi:hypothetical protein